VNPVTIASARSVATYSALVRRARSLGHEVGAVANHTERPVSRETALQVSQMLKRE
jgi:hypothetical protein